jgi:hypothetical protein
MENSDLTKEQRKQATIERAKKNQANFELHKKLIDESIVALQKHLGKESIKYFYETGKVSGEMLLALIEYAENYHQAKTTTE